MRSRLTLADPCIIIQFKQINQPDATILQVHYLAFCFVEHISGASTPIIRSLHLHKQPLVLPLERGGSSVVDRVLAGRPDHD